MVQVMAAVDVSLYLGLYSLRPESEISPSAGSRLELIVYLVKMMALET